VASLSVIVITKNEQDNIQECLATVAWVEEIIVVDAGSTDGTVVEAGKFTKKIFVRPWEGYGAAKNFALKQATSAWILWLDADERVSESLKKEILDIVKADAKTFEAYTMPRKANFLGRWILHCGWYPGRVTRLFRRESGRFSEAKVHERLEIKGTTGALGSDLLHYTDPTLHHYLEKFNKYTTLASEELSEQGQSFGLLQITVRPLWVFIRMYFLKLGMLDGIQGFILCFLSACYVFTKYAKLWERKQ
jgi:glycosyltransferase involved in cell wall biosynthesis